MLNSSENNAFVPLESLASNPNSDMIYAVDHLGNQITLGVFVTDSFGISPSINEEIKFENEQKENISNDNWVAAVEECVTLDTPLSEVKGTSAEIQAIPVYKVNKRSQRKSDKQKDKKIPKVKSGMIVQKRLFTLFPRDRRNLRKHVPMINAKFTRRGGSWTKLFQCLHQLDMVILGVSVIL